MEKLIAWFTNNHVAANLLMLFLIVSGILAMQTIKIETFPEFTLDMISVSMEYPGASPAEIEEAVIRRIDKFHRQGGFRNGIDRGHHWLGYR